MTAPTTSSLARDPRALPLTARIARGVRRMLRIDRERRWNREYAAGGWDWLRNLDELAHHAVLAGYVSRLAPGGAVLDMGCGEGVFQEQLRGAAGRYVGVDFEAAIVKAAAKVDANTAFVVGDMNEFTTTERFDAIVFNESLYYLHDPAAGLARYETMLTPTGVFLVSMHGKARNDAIWAALDERYVTLDSVILENRHGTRWTTKALRPVTATLTSS